MSQGGVEPRGGTWGCRHLQGGEKDSGCEVFLLPRGRRIKTRFALDPAELASATWGQGSGESGALLLCRSSWSALDRSWGPGAVL